MIEDMEKLFARLNTLIKDKKLRSKALQLKSNLVCDGLTLTHHTHHLVTFEKYLRRPDDIQKSKDYIVKWCFETSIFEDKINLLTILDPLTKFIDTVLFVLNFVEQSINNYSSLWKYFNPVDSQLDFKTNLQKLQSYIQERKAIINKDNFTELFDFDKLALYNTYLQKLDSLCVTSALQS